MQKETNCLQCEAPNSYHVSVVYEMKRGMSQDSEKGSHRGVTLKTCRRLEASGAILQAPGSTLETHERVILSRITLSSPGATILSAGSISNHGGIILPRPFYTPLYPNAPPYTPILPHPKPCVALGVGFF